jgi:GTP-binding protein
VFEYQGMKKSEIPFAVAGDIVSVAGVEEADLGDSITDPETPMPLPPIQIDEPTISIEMTVNDSPFFGKEGKFVTSRHIWERLEREIERNPSLVIERSAGQDAFTIKGRGELQFSILVENMRREGYEFQISRPKVLYKDIDGTRHEPMELAMIDVNEEFQGVVIEKMGVRKGELVNMVQSQGGYTRLEFKVPSRGLIGFRNEFLTDTRGTGILNHLFAGYEPFKGAIPTRTRGVLIAMEPGTSVAYALDSLQERGALFIGPGVSLYGGMIIGEHSRENDLEVNACKGKKLTNMRAAGSDDAVRLTPPRQFNFEQALEYISDDELLEITPSSVRMRKKILDSNDRKKASRSGD